MAEFRFLNTLGRGKIVVCIDRGDNCRRLKMKGRFMLRSFFVVLVSVICMPAAIAGIATTRHNLSISGPGEVKATTEQRLCVFCHTPHRAISTSCTKEKTATWV